MGDRGGLNLKMGARRLNKKAAFELSMTTVIIIVMSVIMLILGLVFIKTIMCGAMNIASDTLEGAQSEINKMFGQQQGEETACMGVRDALDILPGSYSIVGCGLKPSVETTYNYKFEITSAKDLNNQNIDTNGWITEELEGSIGPVGAGRTEYATFAIRPPTDAPEGMIVIKATLSKKTGTKTTAIGTPTMRLNVKRAGWLQQSVC